MYDDFEMIIDGKPYKPNDNVQVDIYKQTAEEIDKIIGEKITLSNAIENGNRNITIEQLLQAKRESFINKILQDFLVEHKKNK